MNAPTFYSLRRLSPFRGTLQVVEVPEGRAFSSDGVGWTLQLLSRNPVRETVWGNIGPTESQRRYFSYARWSGEGKLTRVPIDPCLGDQSRHPALTPLLDALKAPPNLPFPPADHLELWLLDQEAGLPLALLKSTSGGKAPGGAHSLSWRSLPAEDRAFHSPRLAQQAPPDKAAQNRTLHRALLEQLIARTAGKPGRQQWFLRGPDGEGVACRVDQPADGDRLVTLSRDVFPELLVRHSWSREKDQALVDDYLNWLAPALLTLPHLRRETRERLEHAASRRAALLYQYHKLFPEIVNREVVQPALVEAVLRLSA